jgi:hypothetical protein
MRESVQSCTTRRKTLLGQQSFYTGVPFHPRLTCTQEDTRLNSIYTALTNDHSPFPFLSMVLFIVVCTPRKKIYSNWKIPMGLLYQRMERSLVKFIHSGDPDVIAEDHSVLGK